MIREAKEGLKPQQGYGREIIGTVVFSLLIFLGLSSLSGIRQTLGSILSADPLFLLPAALLANTGILINSYIWMQVLRSLDIGIDYIETLKLVFSNTFLNNITPLGHAGGEPLIAYHLSKQLEETPGKIFSAITVADLINFTPLITSATLGTVFLYTQGLILSIMPVTGLKEKVKGEIENFRKGLKDLSMSTKELTELITLSHLSILTDTAAVYLITVSVGLETTILPLFLILPLARMANYFPTPGGTGPYEIALTGLLIHFFNITVVQAVTVSLIYRGLTYYLGTVIGAITITKLKKPLQRP